MTARAQAPGKVMIAGEYAVLEGGAALVMAVDRYARAEVLDAAPAPGDEARVEGEAQPETRATLACAARAGLIAHAPAHVRVDTRDQLARDASGRKLGLGSSAAGCVAALTAAVFAAGRDVDSPAARRAIADTARRGHRAAQGGGSGVDVLASALGGVLRVSFASGLDSVPEVESIAWPRTLLWSVLWTGVPVRTSELLRAVRTLQSRDAKRWATTFNDICSATRALTDALRASNSDDAIAAVSAHFTAMDALGGAAGVPIVTNEMRRLASVIEPLGGAIKPSGAGGGDIVLALAKDTDTLAAIRRESAALGFEPLALRVDTVGARVCEGGDG